MPIPAGGIRSQSQPAPYASREAFLLAYSRRQKLPKKCTERCLGKQRTKEKVHYQKEYEFYALRGQKTYFSRVAGEPSGFVINLSVINGIPAVERFEKTCRRKFCSFSSWPRGTAEEPPYSQGIWSSSMIERMPAKTLIIRIKKSNQIKLTTMIYQCGRKRIRRTSLARKTFILAR